MLTAYLHQGLQPGPDGEICRTVIFDILLKGGFCHVCVSAHNVYMLNSSGQCSYVEVTEEIYAALRTVQQLVPAARLYINAREADAAMYWENLVVASSTTFSGRAANTKPSACEAWARDWQKVTS